MKIQAELERIEADWAGVERLLDAMGLRDFMRVVAQLSKGNSKLDLWMRTALPPHVAHRYFAIVLALARHALYAAVALPEGHPQRSIIRHQVDRLRGDLTAEGTPQGADRAAKLARLLAWYDAGGPISDDMAVLSEEGAGAD